MTTLRGLLASGAATVGLTIVVAESPAHASGFASQHFGGEQGNVVATNPTALYYNPGAMGFSHGSQLGIYGSLALRNESWTHTLSKSDVADPADAQGANTGEASVHNVFGGPALGGTLKLGNLVLGAGFFAPFFGRAHWPKNDAFANSKYPLAADGIQRWFVIDGEISIFYFTAGAAYRLGPLSIGAAGNFISSNIVTNQAKNPYGQGFADTTQEGRAYFDVLGFHGSFAAGAMLEAVPDQLWIGASYQAQPGLGMQDLSGELLITTYIGGVKTQKYDEHFNQELPDIFRAGVKWHPKSTPVEVRVFGDLTRWSKMLAQCGADVGFACQVHPDGTDASGGTKFNYRRNWNDTYGGRVGLSYWTQPSIELFLGGGYETAAIPDDTMGPDLADANNILGALGARFQVSSSFYLTASFTHIQFLNRDTTGKSTLPLYAVPTVQPDGGGLYTQSIQVLNGNLEAQF